MVAARGRSLAPDLLVNLYRSEHGPAPPLLTIRCHDEPIRVLFRAAPHRPAHSKGLTAMTHTINWFEIPTTDLKRASRFYGDVLGASFKHEHFAATDMHMAIFQGEKESVTGALIADKRRKPAAEG